MSAIALIPARGGSKRVPGKNIKLLDGRPLISYTISAALDSGCFEKVLVSSDDTTTLDIAARYGADCLRRPDEFATDTSPDIEWVRHALKVCDDRWGDLIPGGDGFSGRVRHPYDTFSILRPTSPFRKPETIQRAMNQWMLARDNYTSLRAMEKVSQHPGKMWTRVGDMAVPLLMQPQHPFHDSQYAALPSVYVQNASLEIAWVKTVIETGTISGKRVMAFETEGDEGLDVNTERDWALAEYLIDSGAATLPKVRVHA